MKVLVICAKRYNGHELWSLLGILVERNVQFEVVSQETLIRDELTLQPNTIDRTVYQVAPDQQTLDAFDGIIVVSGNMDDTEAYWTDNHVISLLEAFRASDKTVAAICCSVPTLAPVCRDVKVSYFPLVRSKQRLLKFGAILEPVSLTVDGKTITAENQMMTQMWATEICNVLEGKDPQFVLRPSGYTPKGSPRILPQEIQNTIDAAKAKRYRRKDDLS